MFELAAPWWWCLLPLPWLLGPLLPAQANLWALRVPFLQRLPASSGLTSPSRPGWSGLLFWLCLLGALSRPQWLDEPIQIPTTGRDLLLAIDTSGSMRERDLLLNQQPASRLEVIQWVVRDFIAQRQGDRLGLVLFGERAYLYTPLSFDRHTISQMLQESEIGLAGQQTAIGDAIGLALKTLKDRPSSQRVLILMTDGQNTAGAMPPLKAAELAAKAGVRIYTLGIGADEIDVNRGFFRQRVANTELDEATLKAIAEQTHGRYFRARTQADLQQIYQQLNQIEKIELEQQPLRPTEELFYWPLLAAIALWSVRRSLR